MRYFTNADADQVGVDFGVTAFEFLLQHMRVLSSLGIDFRVRHPINNETTSQFEITSNDQPVATVTLTVDPTGIVLLMASCNLSNHVHICSATKWKTLSA